MVRQNARELRIDHLILYAEKTERMMVRRLEHALAYACNVDEEWRVSLIACGQSGGARPARPGRGHSAGPVGPVLPGLAAAE